MPTPAIFLDRDGTLCRDAVYMIRFEDFEPLPDVDEALRRLQEAGYRLFVVTNQSGVARGLFTAEAVEALNRRIEGYFKERGVYLEDTAFCPHHPEGKVPEYAIECSCRKPRPGMILDLARKYDLDLTKSYMVGDMLRDVEAGLAAGTQAVLIPPREHAASLDKDGRLKEFTSLLDFANSLRGSDTSHVG
jgi:D-glycero-D-manno-heptose 1,7-bisphosphate phosphatase